jgi:LCP family protein required for cell wall assembly
VFEFLSTPNLRRLGKRILVGLCVVVGTLVVALGAVLVYAAVQLDRVPRVSCDACADEPDDGPVNVLLVGSDSRVSVADEAEQFGTPEMVAGQRSDTMMILRADPDGGRARVLSVPRDLWVPIASGGVDRINTALDHGPDNLVRTVSAVLGVPIHHYAQVEFSGFREIVEAVDGVSVYFPAPARDVVTGLHVERAGCVTLDGERALAYVRSRNYETLIGDRWTGGGASDLDRIARQQDFIRRVLGRVRTVRNPLTIHRVVSGGIDSLTLDERLSTAEIERLALRFRTLVPSDLEMETVPAVFDHVVINRQRASILRIQQPEAKQVVDRFMGRALATATPAPAATTSSVPGQVTTTVPAQQC